MSRSSAARAAERYLNLKPISRVKLSECPVCEETVFADEKTEWKSLEGAAVRVHSGCIPDGVYSPEANRAEGDTS
jgi:hypothetical protein